MIKFYLHTPELYGWQSVFANAVERMASSGMIQAVDEINICVNGNYATMADVLDPLVVLCNKFRILQINLDASKHEWPTINRIKQDVDSSLRRDIIGYAHLKGLSPAVYAKSSTIDWRNYLFYWTIERWRDHVQAIEDGYDTSGVNWLEKPQPHYSGNFWWAASGHLRALTKLDDPATIKWGTPSRYLTDTLLDPGNFRFENEAWIGSRTAKHNELHFSPAKNDCDFHYNNTYPESSYR